MLEAHRSVLVLGLLAVGFLACGSTEMTATGPAAAPRAETCDFEILTSTPLIGYREIGTVDVTPGGYGVNQFTSLSDFKEHIQPNVCKLGGDAAIASANGYGMYIKATVLKRIEVETAPRTPAPAPVAAVAKPTAHGCEFDSQCKGDRICVEGKCQAPAASPAPAEPAPAAEPAPVASTSTTTAKPAASAAAPSSKGTAPAAPKAAAKSAQ